MKLTELSVQFQYKTSTSVMFMSKEFIQIFRFRSVEFNTTDYEIRNSVIFLTQKRKRKGLINEKSPVEENKTKNFSIYQLLFTNLSDAHCSKKEIAQ